MARSDLAGIAAAMREAASVLITTHAHPDGDAVGSMLALAELARALGCRRVQCVVADPVPRLYRWLPGVDAVAAPSKAETPVDLLVLVDASSPERAGSAAKVFLHAASIAIVDHHVEDPPEGCLAFIDSSYAAAGEIVVELFEAAGVAMSRDAAVCAYVAIATDTGGFRFSNTTARTHRMAAALVDCGVDAGAVSARIFDAMPPSKVELLRGVLNRLEFHADGRLVFGAVSQADIAAAGALDEDFDGLINYARNVEGVELAVLVREMVDGQWKVSCRSGAGVSCAQMMKGFGGGGHERAAGATLDLPLDEVRACVLNAGCEALGTSA